MFEKAYGKLLSKLTGLNAKCESLIFDEFNLDINSDALEIKKIEFHELYPTYAFIRNIEFNPLIKINILQKFENLIKWKISRLDFLIVMRNYPLQILSRLKGIAGKIFFLNNPEIQSFPEKEININKKIKIMEEIIKILPYTKEIKRQKLFRMPISRTPLHKLCFPDSEIRRFREDLATQNKTRWTNVDIIEIYDKFNVKIFSDIKQISGSKNLLLYPSFANSKSFNTDVDFYYLIIGRRKDNSELIRALSRPAISKDDYKSS